MVLLLRGLIYFFPAVLNLRQYELFDPSTYSSSLVLNSLGDLLINAFLFCWIVLFIRREVGDRRFNINHKKGWYWAALIFPVILMVVTTFVFASIIKSLIADSRISFNVTNFFSLINISSLGGFVVLATLSLSFFFLSQIILQLISPLLKGSQVYTSCINCHYRAGNVNFYPQLFICSAEYLCTALAAGLCMVYAAAPYYRQ